jgi:KRAB domain-containing zinc finger protein
MLEQLEEQEDLEELKYVEELEQFKKLEQLEQFKQLEQLEHLKQLELLEQLEQLEQLEKLEQLENQQKLEQSEHIPFEKENSEKNQNLFFVEEESSSTENDQIVSDSNDVKPPKERFQCKHCPRRVSSQNVLNKHMNKFHSLSRKYECNFCLKRYVARETMLRHVRDMHGERSHQCPDCEKRFRRKFDLENHQQVAHSDGLVFLCKYCNLPFPAKRYLEKHVNSWNRKKYWECKDCKIGFLHEQIMQRHRREIHNERRANSIDQMLSETYYKEDGIPCTVCTFTANCKKVLRIHNHQKHEYSELNRNSNENTACFQCGQVFPNSKAMNIHIDEVHLCLKVYSCNTCSINFNSKRALDSHLRKLHKTAKQHFKNEDSLISVFPWRIGQC